MDEFGNIITNIKENFVILEEGAEMAIKTRKQKIKGKFVKIFEEVFVDSLLFIVGSTGFLEISKNQGNAAMDLGLKVGDVIIIEL
ncbi:MAG: SAM hydroxide adenosyltransferase [Promethearchaeota archaeon]